MVNPAAIAGVRSCQRPVSGFIRLDDTTLLAAFVHSGIDQVVRGGAYKALGMTRFSRVGRYHLLPIGVEDGPSVRFILVAGEPPDGLLIRALLELGHGLFDVFGAAFAGHDGQHQSMLGVIGHMIPNIFIERLWRTVKYEEVFLKDYEHLLAARESLGEYFGFYNEERRHSSLEGRTPAAVYWEGRARAAKAG